MKTVGAVQQTELEMPLCPWSPQSIPKLVPMYVYTLCFVWIDMLSVTGSGETALRSPSHLLCESLALDVVLPLEVRAPECTTKNSTQNKEKKRVEKGLLNWHL